MCSEHTVPRQCDKETAFQMCCESRVFTLIMYPCKSVRAQKSVHKYRRTPRTHVYLFSEQEEVELGEE